MVNCVCLLCALGWVLPPFLWGIFSVCFSLPVCEGEQDSSWAHSSSRGEDFCPLFVVMQHCAAFSDGGGEKWAANMTVIFGWFIWFLFWVTQRWHYPWTPSRACVVLAARKHSKDVVGNWTQMHPGLLSQTVILAYTSRFLIRVWPYFETFSKYHTLISIYTLLL